MQNNDGYREVSLQERHKTASSEKLNINIPPPFLFLGVFPRPDPIPLTSTGAEMLPTEHLYRVGKINLSFLFLPLLWLSPHGIFKE